MNLLKSFLFFVLLFGGSFSIQAQSAPNSPQELQEILSSLKQRYPDPNAVADPALTKLDFTGLQARFPGMVLLTQPSLPNAQPRSISTQLLPNQVLLVRLPTFKPAKNWDQLDADIRGAVSRGALGVVLDVRDFETANDFAGAGDAASLFCPKDTVLFTVQGVSTAQKVYSVARPTQPLGAPLIILINRRTTGAAEVFAAVMRTQAKAILVGRSTAAQAANFSDVRLTSGRYVRMATEETVLGDGTKLYPRPVTPDIPLFVEDGTEHEALLKIQQGLATDIVRELPARRRLNEASLVREDNPEIDEAAKDEREKKDNSVAKAAAGPQIQDQALIRACDVLRSLRLVNLTKPPAEKTN